MTVNRWNIFAAERTESPYSAMLRTTFPAVVGTLLKLQDTGINYSFLTYKDPDKCDEGYTIQPFRLINQGWEPLIEKAGVAIPMLSTVVVGAIIAGLLDPSGNWQDKICNLPSNIKKNLLNFFGNLKRKDTVHIVALIAGVLVTVLADSQIEEKYDFKPSIGHFMSTMTGELLASITLRVISRIKDAAIKPKKSSPTYGATEENPNKITRQRSNNNNQIEDPFYSSANLVIWFLALCLTAPVLNFTAWECHSPAEVGVGISSAILFYLSVKILSDKKILYSGRISPLASPPPLQIPHQPEKSAVHSTVPNEHSTAEHNKKKRRVSTPSLTISTNTPKTDEFVDIDLNDDISYFAPTPAPLPESTANPAMIL